MDVSNWTGELSHATVAKWKDAGVGLVIVQAVDPAPPYPPGVCRQQLQVCADMDMPTDIYAWLWFGEDVDRVNARIDRNTSGFSIHEWHLDVEDNAGASGNLQYNIDQVGEKLYMMDRDYAGSEQTFVYTGRWFWEAYYYMRNTTAFRTRRLWDANYDGIPDPLRFTPYGGWAECAIKQYRGTSTLSGQGNVDLNVVA